MDIAKTAKTAVRLCLSALTAFQSFHHAAKYNTGNSQAVKDEVVLRRRLAISTMETLTIQPLKLLSYWVKLKCSRQNGLNRVKSRRKVAVMGPRIIPRRR